MTGSEERRRANVSGLVSRADAFAARRVDERRRFTKKKNEQRMNPNEECTQTFARARF